MRKNRLENDISKTDDAEKLTALNDKLDKTISKLEMAPSFPITRKESQITVEIVKE